MNEWAVLLYKLNMRPKFAVFPTLGEALAYRMKHRKRQASILNVMKVQR